MNAKADSVGPRDDPLSAARRVMAALAEPRRAAIVGLLEKRHRSQRGLAEALGISQPLLSHHLHVLMDAGVINSMKCGRVTIYLLNAATLRGLGTRLQSLIQHAESLETIKPC